MVAITRLALPDRNHTMPVGLLLFFVFGTFLCLAQPPQLTSFAVSPAAANCSSAQCAAVTPGTQVTFTYGFSGSPSCANTSSQNICELQDNYYNNTLVSSASGTVSITPTVTRYYQMVATTTGGPSFSSTFGKGPGSMFIPVFVGSGTLSVTVQTLEGCALISSLWTCPQNGVVKIEVIDNSGPCTGYNVTTGCTGSTLDSNKNPIQSSQGRITLLGQSSGNTTVADAWFCPYNNVTPTPSQQMCNQDNTWAFSYRCATAETITWSGYYGNQSDYAAISGSFVCKEAGGNVVPRLLSYGSNHLFKTADGRAARPVQAAQGLFGGYDFGNGISDTLGLVGDAGFQESYGLGQQFAWSRDIQNGLDIYSIGTGGQSLRPFHQGCYADGSNGIFKCGSGQIYPQLTQAPASILNTLSSLSSYYETVRNLNRAGVHIFFSGLLTICNSNDTPQFLLYANGCDPLGSPLFMFAYTQATKLLLDMFGPYIDAFPIESNDSGGFTFAPDYYYWMSGFVHQYPEIMVAQGYTWAGSSYGIDLALGPENYFQGATEPALSGPEVLASDYLVNQLSAIGAGTPVCRSEGGLAGGATNTDSDHNWNELWRLELWINMLRSNACPGFWPSAYGVGAPQGANSSGNNAMYIGDQEDDALTHVKSAFWDMDPAAAVLFGGQGESVSTCGKTVFVIGMASTRDFMIHVSNDTDRNACSGGSVTVTMPAGMLGYWYSTGTGAILGSQVSVDSGRQTLALPNFGNAVNCTSPPGSCLPDHIVFRARANISGQPLISQVMLPNVLVGQSYSATISAQGCAGTGCTYQITTGTFPDGITMTAAGFVSGTPTVPATRLVGITATDSVGNVSPEQRYWIMVWSPIIFVGGSSTTQFVQSGFNTSPINDVVPLGPLFRGGAPPVSCAVTSGSLSGAGAATSGNMCGIVFTPSVVGSGTATLTATDALGNTASQDFTIQGIAFGAFDGTYYKLASLSGPVTAGQWAGFAMAMYNLSGTPTWSVSAGSLPPGMSLSYSKTIACGRGSSCEMLSGVPTTAGTYSFTLQYVDGNGTSPEYPVTMSVVNPVQLGAATITEAPNTPWIYNLTVTNGSPNVACHILGGVVPKGVLFDPATCTFYGSSVPATSAAIVEAIDPWGSTQSQRIVFDIHSTVIPRPRPVKRPDAVQ